jgi:ribonucrease Y
MLTQSLIISSGIALICVAVALYIMKRTHSDNKLRSTDDTAKKMLDDAGAKVQSMIAKAHSDAQDLVSSSRRNVESEVQDRRKAIAEVEDRVMKRERYMSEKEQKLNEKDNQLSREIEQAKVLKKKQESIIQELSEKLEKAAGFSKEEAKDILLANVEREVRTRAGVMIKTMEEQAQKIANRRAKEIVTEAIQRTAVDHIIPATTSVVKLPDDEMKGRIIGREGRNIRAFESATGVDVIIDDTPGAVVLSAFDPIRREIATMTMNKLIQDGRIHPTRIEEAVDKSRLELTEIIKERGEKAAEELGLKFHPKILELLGKLYYRTSYGQNMLAHAIECGILASNMADLLGVNRDLATRGAVLHDIGKAIDFEQGGSHVDLGDEICRKYGESEEVINCINAHHEDEEPDTIEAVIVCVADAISSARPGARRESVEKYIKRLEKLEALAHSFEGVDKAYAIQAGREVRVLVRPDEIDDPGSQKLAHDIATRIESELDYPGEVKVSVVRETRAVGIAR